jgi:beta-phosphoglucomutase-like phosphatase (HAD superfamily)
MKALIFDLDGTLIDTVHSVAGAPAEAGCRSMAGASTGASE